MFLLCKTQPRGFNGFPRNLVNRKVEGFLLVSFQPRRGINPQVEHVEHASAVDGQNPVCANCAKRFLFGETINQLVSSGFLCVAQRNPQPQPSIHRFLTSRSSSSEEVSSCGQSGVPNELKPVRRSRTSQRNRPCMLEQKKQYIADRFRTPMNERFRDAPVVWGN